MIKPHLGHRPIAVDLQPFPDDPVDDLYAEDTMRAPPLAHPRIIEPMFGATERARRRAAANLQQP